MRAQRSWPERFRVLVRIGPESTVPYTVVTWLAEEKAIAMAVTEHLRRHREASGIYDVEVQDVGPVDRDARGAMVLERDDITDRTEF